MSGGTLAAPSREPRWPLTGATSIAWPLVAIAIVLVMHLSIAFSRALNWDEFYHYSQIHVFIQGDLSSPLQSLQSRIFAWIVALPESSIDHVLIIRMAMFVCLAAAAGGVFLVAERFVERPVAALAALLYLSAGFVIQHGTAFRTDPMAAALLMASLAVMLRSKLTHTAICVAASLSAVAILLTIKSVLYAPAFAAIAWFRWSEAGKSASMARRLIALALAVPVLFALFYLLHSAGLAEASTAADGDLADRSARMMFARGEVQVASIVKAAATAPFLAFIVLWLPFVLLRQPSNASRAAIAGMWLPVLTIAIYRNSWPYFYVFILPPVAAAGAIALRPLAKRYSLAAACGALVLNAAVVWASEEQGVLAKQRAIVAAANEIFPRPVAYFDFPGMLASFDKANGFTTTWGTINYLNGLHEPMHAIMRRETVPLVLENRDQFTAVLRGKSRVPSFLREDEQALRSNYVNFWGPYWLAGKVVPNGESEHREEFLVPGVYTVRDGPIMVDGEIYQPDDMMQLERGFHRLRGMGARDTRLIWGERPREPSYLAPQPPYWTGF